MLNSIGDNTLPCDKPFFASLDVVCLLILVCGSILISVCMFIVSKALLISSATIIVRTGGVIYLVEPLCYGVVYCV